MITKDNCDSKIEAFPYINKAQNTKNGTWTGMKPATVAVIV